MNRTALLVEDEWLVRMEIADALEEAGWDTIEFSSGEDAVAFLEQQQRIDLLVTDIRLIGAVTGWDVAETARAMLPDIAVIYASANPAIESRLVSGSVFFSKPPHVAELVASSEKLWSMAH